MPVMFETTDLYIANKQAVDNDDIECIVNQGGSWSGKTYSILQILFTCAYEDAGCVITVAGQDLPNLKTGAIRDAADIVQKSKVLQALIESYNRSEFTYYFKNGSVLEFKSYADAQDAKSGKRDYLFVNEANGVSYAVFTELYRRTRKKTFVDYNPNEEFWVHENLIGKPKTRLIISDHRHNPHVPQKNRDRLEALKDEDEDLWKVYARGLTGKVEGLVFRNYIVVDGIPPDADLIADGLDFGFTNDPSALVQVYKYNRELWIREIFYETGLTNPMICQRFKENSISHIEEIIADSAEPKSIQEICNEGYNCYGVEKGADSIRLSINILKRFKLNITRDSTGLLKEIKSYKWKVDKISGKTLNEPVGVLDHSIAGLRYVALTKLGNAVTGAFANRFARA